MELIDIVSPLQAMKAPGNLNARVDMFIATALGKDRVARPKLGRIYLLESPRY